MLKNSFKLYYALILSFFVNNASFSQTYNKGKSVESLSSIATTSLLLNNSRIDHSTAYTKLKSIYPSTYYKNASELVGEFWLIDGMLINIISRKISSTIKRDDLEAVNFMSAPQYSQQVGTPKDVTMLNDYFYEIKVVKNSDVLIFYYKTLSGKKSFVIQDKLGKYKVLGYIYANQTDYVKAHNYINTVINSLDFKSKK